MKRNANSELGALLGGKSVRPKSFSRKMRNFFTFCVLADRTPRSGKSQNTGFLGPFGPGQPLALREIRAQNGKTRFPRARGTFGGEIRPSQKFLPKIAQFFYTLRFGPSDRHGREIAKSFAILETFSVKTETHTCIHP